MTTSAAAANAKITASNSALVRHYLKPVLFSAIAACVMAVSLGAVSALVGVLVGPCIDIITAPKDAVLTFSDLLGPRLAPWVTQLLGTDRMAATELIERIPTALITLAFVKGILGLLQWGLWERAGEIASLHLRDDLTAGYLSLAPSLRREEEARDVEAQLSSGVTTDVKLLREYLVHFYGGLPREFFQVIFYAATLIMLSPKLTAIFLLGVAPAAALASRVGKVLRRRAAAALADYSQLSEWLQQRLLGIETIKHYRTEGIEIAKMQELTTSLYQRFLRAARVKARTSPMLEAIGTLALVIVLIVALRDINKGTVTGAVELSVFSTLALLSQAASRLGRYLNSNREGAAAVDRLRRLLSFFGPRAQSDVAPPVTITGGQNKIICKGLTAIYPGANVPALSGVTYAFSGGQIYCLAGPSGAGKSTLFNILLGLVKPAAGKLQLEAKQAVDGTGTCYMPQKVLLMPDTVAANVAYPEALPDEARVREALDRVGMSDVINQLEGNINARVGEGGLGVSGGQAQRVLLARLWYHQKPFVLVDEGTSALDPEVERLIYSLLRELAKRGAVVITIAHRLAAAEAADVLLLLDHGKLIKSGAPATVMATPEFQKTLR